MSPPPPSGGLVRPTRSRSVVDVPPPSLPPSGSGGLVRPARSWARSVVDVRWGVMGGRGGGHQQQTRKDGSSYRTKVTRLWAKRWSVMGEGDINIGGFYKTRSLGTSREVWARKPMPEPSFLAALWLSASSHRAQRGSSPRPSTRRRAAAVRMCAARCWVQPSGRPLRSAGASFVCQEVHHSLSASVALFPRRTCRGGSADAACGREADRGDVWRMGELTRA